MQCLHAPSSIAPPSIKVGWQLASLSYFKSLLGVYRWRERQAQRKSPQVCFKAVPIPADIETEPEN